MAETLEEVSPRYGWRSYSATVLLIELLILVLFSPIIVTATWPKFREALTVFAVAGLFTLPLALLCGWTHQAYNRSKSGWVKYANGTLSCVADSVIHSVPLARCRWYYGNSTRATVPFTTLLLTTGSPAILIEFPAEHQTDSLDDLGRSRPPGPVVVAVGFDSRSRPAWEGVLQNSGALHDMERQAMPAPLSGNMWALFVMFALPSGFLGALYGSAQAAKALVAMGVAQDIAYAVTFPLFVPGSLFLIGYAFLFVLLRERRCHTSKERREAVVAPLRPGMRWIRMLALILLGVWVTGSLDLTSKILMTAVTLLLTGLVAWHFHVLLKDPDSEDVE